MRTTLYEKLFIDGFQKPSYVVATLAFDRLPPAEELTDAIVRTLERHPRLRSIARTWLGVPVALEPRPACEWRARGGLRRLESADVHALEEALLGAPLDIRRALPLEVYAIARPATLVVKAHHAVIDAASGFGVLDDFTRLLAGHEPRRHVRPASHGARGRRVLDGARGRRALDWPSGRRALEWASGVQLAPRVPGPGVVARYRPTHSLEREPVAYTERLLAGAHERLARRARDHGATLFELVASALLSGMQRYNAARGSARAPETVGLMFARARRELRTSQASFRADTGVVAVPSALLATPHHRATLAELRRATRDRRHNDVALAALYAARKLRRPSRAPSEQTAICFTLSDLTAFGQSRRDVDPTSGSPAIAAVRVLASPTSFDHAGMLVSRFRGDVRLSLVAHRGAVDADALLGATLACLSEDS